MMRFPRSVSLLLLVSAMKSAPVYGTSFCGFPLDFLFGAHPFDEPLQVCHEFVPDEASCEIQSFFSTYNCFWQDGACTSDPDLAGTVTTCPSEPDAASCGLASWSGARNCVWWEPTAPPSSAPSSVPSTVPSDVPTEAPSTIPSDVPSEAPSMIPSDVPSEAPSTIPSDVPSRTPTVQPSDQPSVQPSLSPSKSPSLNPTSEPSVTPSQAPSSEPSMQPSQVPSVGPTGEPSESPSDIPSREPSASPSLAPSATITGVPSDQPSSSPSQSPSKEPTAVPSSSPSMTPTAAPSKDPTSEPSALPSLAPSQTLTEKPSVTPSLSPSLSPTNEPSQFPSSIPSSQPSKEDKDTINTGAPTTSQMPSTSPTATPTIVTHPPVFNDPQKFSWNIARLGDPIVAFDDRSDAEEIMVDYNISLRENTVMIYQDDCKTAVPTSVIGVNKVLTPVTAEHGLLEVDLDIMQANIVGSPIWSENEVGIGNIDICIRVDLWLVDDPNPPESVNFHETKLYLTIDLTQNFQVVLDLNRTASDEIAQSAKVNYTLVACHCDETSLACIDEALTPGSDMHLCVDTTSPNINFVSILDVEMTQNALKWHPVKDSVMDDLTAVILNGDKCLLRTQMASAFFAEENPPDVIVEGLALLEFKDTGTRVRARYLQGGGVPAVDNEEDVGSFSVQLGLSSGEVSSGANDNTKGVVSIFAVTLSAFVFLL